MHVKCQAGCVSLFREERVDILPPDCEEDLEYSEDHVELNEEGRVDAHEGREANESEERSYRGAGGSILSC